MRFQSLRPKLRWCLLYLLLSAPVLGLFLVLRARASWRPRTLSPIVPYMQTIAFSPDGKFLVAGGTTSIVAWDVQTRSLLKRINIDTSKQGFCATETLGFVSPNSQSSELYSSCNLFYGANYNACLWDIQQGKSLKQLRLPKSESIRLPKPWFAPDSHTALSLDGTLMAVIWQQQIILMSLRDHKVMGHLKLPPPANEGFSEDRWLNFSPNGKWIASNTADFVVMGEVKTGRMTQQWPAGGDCAAIFSADSQRVITSISSENSTPNLQGKLIQLRDIATGHCVAMLPSAPEDVMVNAMAVSSDGQTLVGETRDGAGTHSFIRVWDLRSSQLIRTLKRPHPNHEYAPVWGNHVAVSPDGTMVASLDTIMKGNTYDKSQIMLWRIK